MKSPKPRSGRNEGVLWHKPATAGVEGGKNYDALLLAAGRKSGADRIYTTNVRHFHSLADEELRARIMAP